MLFNWLIEINYNLFTLNKFTLLNNINDINIGLNIYIDKILKLIISTLFEFDICKRL